MVHHHQQELNRQALNKAKIKVKFMVMTKLMALIKGENKVVKLKKMIHKLKMMMMDLFNNNHKCFFLEFIKAFNGIILPTTSLEVEEALDDPDWMMAMQEELNNFTRNEVWELVERLKQNVIGTKWVFCNKEDEHCVVTRNRARFQIKQMKEGTLMCQTKYTRDMLKKFDMAGTKPIKTPMALNGHLDLNEEGKSVDQTMGSERRSKRQEDTPEIQSDSSTESDDMPISQRRDEIYAHKKHMDEELLNIEKRQKELMAKNDIPHSPLRAPMDVPPPQVFYNPWEEIGHPSMFFGASQGGDEEEDFGGREHSKEEEEEEDISKANTPKDEDEDDGDDDDDKDDE
ncbi:uncharacterized protein LOC106804390 [Setaria italica]|uniref:uncharacterized protein LOC106804390 n=1 Tax=Setaria italica TaxID=4555 RepID=UPI0007199E6E|nr:uncharacterized protein LOC106804390 [Setaria italica]